MSTAIGNALDDRSLSDVSEGVSERMEQLLNETFSVRTIPSNIDNPKFYELPKDGHVVLTITEKKLGPGFHPSTDAFNEKLKVFFRTKSVLSRGDIPTFLQGEDLSSLTFWKVKEGSGSLRDARGKKQRAPYLDVTLESVSGGDLVDTIRRRYNSFKAEAKKASTAKALTTPRLHEHEDHKRKERGDDGTPQVTPPKRANNMESPQVTPRKCANNMENGHVSEAAPTGSVPEFSRLPTSEAEELRFATPATVNALGGASSPFVKFLIALKNGESSRNILVKLQQAPEIATFIDPKGKTALHHAVGFSHTQAPVVEKLLELNPEAIAMRTKRGDTPLHLACFAGAHSDILELLYNRYPEAADVLNNSGWDPLFLAHNLFRPGAIKFLTDKLNGRRPQRQVARHDPYSRSNDNPLNFGCNMIQRGELRLTINGQEAPIDTDLPDKVGMRTDVMD